MYCDRWVSVALVTNLRGWVPVALEHEAGDNIDDRYFAGVLVALAHVEEEESEMVLFWGLEG